MEHSGYPSDLTDAQWEEMEPLIPPAKPGGRPRTANMRAVLNAINYVVRTGCQWRFLPRDFPPKSTVYDYFWQWGRDDLWETMHDTLRRQVRRQAGREASPSAAVIDSQTVKTTEKRGRAALTAARKSPAENATSSSTPSDWSSR
jgi:putative transposase